MKLLLRMEKWARDGNLGSWTRRSETEERLLRTPPPTPLPSRHFHSRNDETTSDWIEDSRTSVRECDFSKSKKMMRINSRGFIMITYLFISILPRKGATYYSSSPPGRMLIVQKQNIPGSKFHNGKEDVCISIKRKTKGPKRPRSSILIPRVSLAGPFPLRNEAETR